MLIVWKTQRCGINWSPPTSTILSLSFTKNLYNFFFLLHSFLNQLFENQRSWATSVTFLLHPDADPIQSPCSPLYGVCLSCWGGFHPHSSMQQGRVSTSQQHYFISLLFLTVCCSVASFAVICCCFHRYCSSELGNCMPVPWPICTKNATQFHAFTMHLLRVRVEQCC